MIKTKGRELNTSSITITLLFLYLVIFPLFGNDFSILNITGFMYQILLASSLVLIWGYCGIFSFAQAAFFGIGGYCYGIITLNAQNPALTPVALLVAVASGFVVAGIFGYFLFYGGVNDSFIGIITLCFTMVLETFMQQTAAPKWKIGRVALNGFNGINRIPPLHIGKIAIVDKPFYYVVLVTIIAVYAIYRAVERRNIGYTLKAIQENAHRTSLLGYNVAKIKTLVFACGGAIAALAGVYYTMWGGYIVPTSMNITSATIPIVLAAAGGRKNAAAVYIFGLGYLKFAQSLAAKGTQYAFVVLGALLIIVVLIVPDGIVETLFRFLDRTVLDKIKDKFGKGGVSNVARE